MASEWIAPISTAVVGLGGIAATYFAASTQRRAQIEMIRLERSHKTEDDVRAEKKIAYLRFLGAVSDTANLIRSQPQSPDDADVQITVRRMERELQTSVDEVAMVAPDWVIFQVGISHATTLLWMAKKLGGGGDNALFVKMHLARGDALASIKADLAGEGEEEARRHMDAFHAAWKKSPIHKPAPPEPPR